MSAVLKYESQLPSISVEANAMAVDLPDGPTRMPVTALPEHFIDWMEEGRRGMYNRLKGKQDSVEFFSQHLPVLVTQSPNSVFPFNCGNKGVGFLPKMNIWKNTVIVTEKRWNVPEVLLGKIHWNSDWKLLLNLISIVRLLIIVV